MEEKNNRRVMVIMAHPDDPEFFCGGTIGRWAREGAEIIYVVITNGSKGSDDATILPERLVTIRELEQQHAAQLLGVRQILFLGYVDGNLVADDFGLRCELTRLIRRYRPDAVMCQDPTTWITLWGSVNHSDHRAAGAVTLDSVFPAARNPFYCRELLEVEGLEPHKVREVYLAGSTQPDTFIDVTDVIDLKIQAIRQHASQIGNPDELAQRIKNRLKFEEDGQVRYREAFRRLDLP